MNNTCLKRKSRICKQEVGCVRFARASSAPPLCEVFPAPASQSRSMFCRRFTVSDTKARVNFELENKQGNGLAASMPATKPTQKNRYRADATCSTGLFSTFSKSF